MQIVTNQFQKELKKHGNDHFPFLVSHHNPVSYTHLDVYKRQDQTTHDSNSIS